MRTVLIADSDSFQRQLIDMLLAVDNHRIIGFDTGRQVLEYLQSHVPDVMIVDYNLPDINGADLCAKLKKVKRLAKVPVILVTAAHKLELVRGIAVAVRADLVLAKPLGDKQLREHVLELLKAPGADAASALVTPLRIDPILEQALVNLTQETPSLHTAQAPADALTPVPIDRGEPAPYALELPTSLPLQPIVSQSASNQGEPEAQPPLFHEEASTALESLLEQSQPSPQSAETASGDDHPEGIREDIFEFYEEGISEQELLASLREPLEPKHTTTHESEAKPILNPPPLEPQPYTLGEVEPMTSPEEPLVFEEDVPPSLEAELDILRTQVGQLTAENERLRATLLELEGGANLTTTKSYLDAIEELEMLRRLNDIQIKQLDGLQRQNQKLMEENNGLQERKRGLFSFWQPKNQTS